MRGTWVGGKTETELLRWKDVGLLDFQVGTDYDQIVADVLAIVRERLVDLRVEA